MSTQLDCSIGLAPETLYGTAVPPTRFFEFLDESFDWAPTFVQGAGLRVGTRLDRSARRGLGMARASGDMTVEAVSKGLGVLFAAALGSSSSTVVAGGLYQQVHTPTTSDYLPSYTIQKGIPRIGGGGIDAITFLGAVCSAVDISCGRGEIAKVKTTWDCKDVTTAPAYAAPSYPSAPELFTFVGGSIGIGGTLTLPTPTTLAALSALVGDITDVSTAWDNKLDDSGFTLGGAGRRTHKPAVGLASLTGSVTAEYDTAVLRDAYLNQTDLAMLLTFVGAVDITTGNKPTLQAVIPNIRLEGELPKSNAGDTITQSVGFTGLDNLAAASPFYIVTRTSDIAV